MASLTWTGLEELAFRTALRTLPERLTGEAQGIVKGAAEDAMAAMTAAYPSRTGTLRRRLTKVEQSVGQYSVGVQVRNTSPHAWMFENGTQARHTALGANRGVMPPGHVFIPAAERHRAQMYQRLRDMLVREGLVVTGDAA